jgi:hypothetical protein
MTERLIPFDLEAAKADPSRMRHADGTAAHETLFGSDGAVICRWSSNSTTGWWTIYEKHDLLRLTAPAPKRVEVRAALWSNGRFSLYDNNTFCFKSIESNNLGFVRWLTNWHIEDGKVFVEVE